MTLSDTAVRLCHQPTCRKSSTVLFVDRWGDEIPCCDYHLVLKRAGWQCEAIIEKRLKPGEFMRCPCAGSEIDVVEDEARCPHHREVRNV